MLATISKLLPPPPGVGQEHFSIPLRTLIPSFKGQAYFTPKRFQNTLSGVSYYDYDTSQKVLWVYYAVSGFSIFRNPTIHKNQNFFYRSPVDGGKQIAEQGKVTNYPIPANDDRTIPKIALPGAWSLFTAKESIPISYDYLFEDRATACPHDEEQKWKAFLETVSWADLVARDSEPDVTMRGNSESGLVPVGYLEGASILKKFSDSVVCSSSYLAGMREKSHGIDTFEALVWGHFVIESPDGPTKPTALLYENFDGLPKELEHLGTIPEHLEKPASLSQLDQAQLSATEVQRVQDAKQCWADILSRIEEFGIAKDVAAQGQDDPQISKDIAKCVELGESLQA
eukprot:TRINITY_DN12083_c0_g1_i3.p2 TRINITY_DN12083_c0_g1~~TRINITY_DN12083_c0_g1_i3.p2  ORF type:complete len:342 (-),score=22.72 TRINITY_DN12083_c0_g1_i3:39-1064(-)